jgi:3(or 17)beta-hydroxysteroid dehydrogenase
MNRLKGKVAIITGAARGLGEADARLFVAEGALVTITDIDQALGSALAAELGCHFIQQDVSDEARWSEVIEQTLERFGRLDILVNNAGMVKAGNPENQTTEEYRLTMAVHADGVFFGCRAAIPAMAASGGGSIINMCSLAAIQGESYVAAYCMAKGGIDAYTRAVAVHCAQNKNGVRCNSIHPSGIDTPMVAEFGDQMANKYGEEVLAAIAAGASASGEPLDIANAALYLASDESKFVNGTRIVVDNSMSVTSGFVAG